MGVIGLPRRRVGAVQLHIRLDEKEYATRQALCPRFHLNRRLIMHTHMQMRKKGHSYHSII